jgi:hypothetical protein
VSAVHLGRLVATAGVVSWAGDDPARHSWLFGCVDRHVAGDWGDLDRHDVQVNDRAVQQRVGRVLSAYPLPAELVGTNPDSTLWIITDDVGDPASPTTLLWPSEY